MDIIPSIYRPLKIPYRPRRTEWRTSWFRRPDGEHRETRAFPIRKSNLRVGFLAVAACRRRRRRRVQYTYIMVYNIHYSKRFK